MLKLAESQSSEMSGNGRAAPGYIHGGNCNVSIHNLKLQLAEFASELLRLQSQPDTKPRCTGLLAPDELQRWTQVDASSEREPPCTPGGYDTTPTTPGRKIPTTPLESLPTPSSTSEGRSEAADLLISRIQEMQLDNDSTTIESKVADFTGEGLQSDYEELCTKKGEAEAEVALLSAELVALRGKHEEEKRQMMKTAKDLRRRNEELEKSITLHRMGSSSGRIGGGAEQAQLSRAVSCPRPVEGDDEGDKKFGSRLKGLALRWASPHPARANSQSSIGEEVREANPPSSDDHGSCASTIDTNDHHGNNNDLDQVEIIDETQSTTPEESAKLIAALEEQQRHSEHRATVLEQRLTIVKESGDAVIQSLNEELADLADDRAQSESAMIKELSILDSQRRAERDDYEQRIQNWISHDASRIQEVEAYQARIQSLLGTVQVMTAEQEANNNHQLGTVPSSSFDPEAVGEMYNDLIEYIELLEGKDKKNSRHSGSLVMSINQAFDLEFNANPMQADDMIAYYHQRPELKEFTLKSELPRMDYEVLVRDESGTDSKLVETDEIRSYFATLDENNDEEIETIIRAANQSLLADPLAMLTCEGDGKLVHSGSFHSTVIATVCSFKLDLRREGERRLKVQCELAVCVPSGKDHMATEIPEEKEDNVSATLELARAHLVIQFSPSPTATPSGPLYKILLMDIQPTFEDYEEGSDNAKELRSAAAVLSRDRHTHIQYKGSKPDTKSSLKGSFLSRMKSSMSSRST